MGNKSWRKNAENDPLSVSYHEGVERLAGVTDHIAFKVPTKIVKNRKQFWSELFHKYTEQILDDSELDIRTFKPCIRESVSKSLSLVQYWVNTGYLPYNIKKIHTDKDAQPETVVSLSEEYFSLSDHHVVEEKANTEHVEINLQARSSSSSVDTAAYILSNTNTTNKAETMAIVEGAKHRRVSDSQCRESVEVIQVAADKQHQKSNEDIVVDKNGNSYEPHSLSSSRIAECELQQELSRVEENVAHLQETSVIEANRNILLESKSNDTRNKNSHTKPNLDNIQLSPTEQSYFENEITSPLDSTITNRNRKKLYTGRDSPVDLLNMKTSNKYIIPKLKRYLHPALDFPYKQPRKYKICKQRRRKNSHSCNSLLNSSHFSIFRYKHRSTKKRKNFNDISMAMSNLSKIDDKHSKNGSVTDCSTKDRSLIERDNFHCVKPKILNNGCGRSKSKLSTSMGHVEKDNKITHKEKIRNLCPVVYLKRLSKFDIEKYKRSTSVIQNRNNRIMRQLSTNLRNSKPAVCRSKPEMQKHKQSNKTFGTYEIVNPIVLLESLTEFELRNYKTVPNSGMNMDNLNPTVRLKRLTEADICRYKSSNAIKTQSQNALFPDTVHSQDIQVKNNQHLEVIPSYCSESSTSIINLVYEDTASDQSTLLFCKCAPDVSLENSSATNLSVSSANSSQTDALFMDTGKQMLESKLTVSRKAKIKHKVDMIGNKVDLSSSDNGSKKKVKRLTRNRKNKRVMENKTIKNTPDVNESSKMRLRSSTINVGVFKTKNVWKSDTASSSDNLSDIYDNKNTNSNNIFLSDEEDNFVKLVHCPEDVQQSKLKQRYKILNQDFNSKVEKAKGDRLNTSNSSMKRLRNIGRKWKNSKVFSESTTEDSQSLEDFIAITPRKLPKSWSPGREQCNEELSIKQAVVGSNNKMSSNVDSITDKTKSNIRRLCFRTKIFDSDSESFTV